MELEICLLSQDNDLHGALSQHFATESINVTMVARIDHALRRLQNSHVLLLLIDEDQTGRPAIEILKKVRSNQEFDNNYVALYSRKTNEIDRVLAFEFGADNYLVKPMPFRELALRIHALVRHAPKAAADVPKELRNGRLFVDRQSHDAFINDEPVELTAIEFRLLCFLMERPEVVHDRETLLQQVWRWCDKEENGSGVSRTVDTHVKRLRQKLSKCGNTIETVRGVGYRYNPKAALGDDTSVTESPQSRHSEVTERAY